MAGKLKAPVFTKRNRKRMTFRRRWYLVKKVIISYLKSTPRLQIIFTNDDEDYSFSDDCHCNTLPSTCYLLQIESNFPFGKFKRQSVLMSLIFPEESNLNIETFTLQQRSGNKGLYCQELNLNWRSKIEYLKIFRSKLKPHFLNDSNMQKCIILFAINLHFFYLLQFFHYIIDWFPKSNIPIWGGLLDKITVCQYRFKKKFCTNEAEMVLLFISSPDMKVWTLTLDETCNSMITIKQKLTTFKEKVELKLYSTALMYFSTTRINELDTIESKAFKEIFPNMILFQIYGEASIGGERWLELDCQSIMESQNTTFIILTYN